MPTPLERWRNRSPGDLDLELDEVCRTDVDAAIVQAQNGLGERWSRLPLKNRIEALRKAQDALKGAQESLAMGICRETGKPIQEARQEMTAVVAKFDFSFQDAEEHLTPRSVGSGPHPALVRNRPRGLSAVIAPFNFPIHLGHGAAVAHLLAGNPVLFKPSPLAAAVAAQYARLMQSSLPEGVFVPVQGGAETGSQLCTDPRVRAICFTGSLAAGRSLSTAVASDIDKEVALELGGKNAALICADADLDLAAKAIVDGMTLTAGQRCNSTSRVLVDQSVRDALLDRLIPLLQSIQPGSPILETTRLGALIHAAAVDRYQSICSLRDVEWLLPGKTHPIIDGKRGYFVSPALALLNSPPSSPARQQLVESEFFCPVAIVQSFRNLEEAVILNNDTPFGLTTSVFTRSETTFLRLAEEIQSGNIYANLPTTFSPSALPFGGWGNSGNHRPGGRGFIRFTTQEQALQWLKF